jgi:hypothetical protein
VRCAGVRELVFGLTKHGVILPQGSPVCQRAGDEPELPNLHEQVVSVRVLASGDPMWRRIKDKGLFQHPVVIPLSADWPSLERLLAFRQWHADPSGARSAQLLYDYVVWWPASRPGKRGA